MTLSNKFNLPEDDLTFGPDPAAFPDNPNDNATHITTTTGDENGDLIAIYKYDLQTDTWIEMPSSPDTRLVSAACYSEEVSTPEVSTTTNTRNVGPALAGLVVSFDVPVDNYRLLSFRANLDGTGSGNFTVTNTTTGETSETSTESWAGASTAVSAQTFTLDTPVSGNVGDIITLSSNIAGGRWRYTFTTVGPLRLGTSGSATGPAFSMAGFIVGEIFISERYKVQTYEDAVTGALTLVQTDDAGVRTEIASVPAGWTEVPCSPDWVKEECYQEPGAATIYENDPFLDEINPGQLATLPAGAHMRWTAPTDTLLNTLEVNGFNSTVTISWNASTGDSGSQSVTFGTNPQGLDLGGLPLAAGDTIDFTLDSISAGQMQLTAAAASIANGWTALQDYSAFANTSHWATRLLTSDPGTTHIVRTYEDGSLAEVDRDGNALTPLASTPAEWAPLSHVGCEDHSAITDRLDAVEASLAALPVPVAGDSPITVKAAGSVNAAGNAEEIVNATVSRAGVGQYDITFINSAPTATYPVLATMQGLPQNDDYQWAYVNRTANGFRIEIREQDNGAAAGVLRDSGFSFQVLTLG